MKKYLALVLALVVIAMFTVPLVGIADGLTVTDTYMPVMADKATPEPVYANADEEPIETDPGGDQPFQIDITTLLDWLIRSLLIPLIGFLMQWVHAKIGDWKFMMVMSAVNLGVKGAEEKFGSGHGIEKYNEVVEYLKRRGIRYDETEINAMVYDEFNKLKAALKSASE